jgi:hypothetical protein
MIHTLFSWDRDLIAAAVAERLAEADPAAHS